MGCPSASYHQTHIVPPIELDPSVNLDFTYLIEISENKCLSNKPGLPGSNKFK